MRIYKIKDDIVLSEMKCNKCGKDIMVDNGMVKEGAFNLEYDWGYFSDKDGQKHIFDLCEKCYDHIVSDFKIEIQVKENVELL